MNKRVHIFSGGTISHISPHLALSAPAYGSTGDKLLSLCEEAFPEAIVDMERTKMAGGDLETNEDVSKRVDELVADLNTMVVFFNCALVDFGAYNISETWEGETFGECGNKYGKRLSSENDYDISITAHRKIISKIRKDRKDIFLVGFKATCGATEQEMYEAGLKQLKTSHVNLCLVNDAKTRLNMIVTPEEATYCVTTDRDKVLREIVDMAYYRSQLKFTQSTVLEGEPVSWFDERLPDSLRTVVDYCVTKNAYKVFNNATVGHFACKLSDTQFLTSIRRSNFNNIAKTGLVHVKTSGPDTVLAYGAKPSVGGQSQRIVFNDHKGMDAIVHFHCELRENPIDDIPIRSQREVECGSHQCGKNTSEGLKKFGNLKAVYLDKHGPNIVFPKNIDPQEVIDFIERNFDLSKKTGGYQL